VLAELHASSSGGRQGNSCAPRGGTQHDAFPSAGGMHLVLSLCTWVLSFSTVSASTREWDAPHVALSCFVCSGLVMLVVTIVKSAR